MNYIELYILIEFSRYLDYTVIISNTQVSTAVSKPMIHVGQNGVLADAGIANSDLANGDLANSDLTNAVLQTSHVNKMIENSLLITNKITHKN